jgi:hypothetical protein
LHELGYQDPPISQRALEKIHPPARTPNQPPHGASRPAKRIGNKIRKERPIRSVSANTPLHVVTHVGQQRQTIKRVVEQPRVAKGGKQAKTTQYSSKNLVQSNRPLRHNIR